MSRLPIDQSLQTLTKMRGRPETDQLNVIQPPSQAKGGTRLVRCDKGRGQPLT